MRQHGYFIAAAETGSITEASKRAMSREYFRALFLRERLEPTIAWVSPQPEVVRTMVANDLGFSLANIRPRSNRALDGRRVYAVPLAMAVRRGKRR